MAKKSLISITLLGLLFFFGVLISLFIISHKGRQLVYDSQLLIAPGIGKTYMDKPALFRLIDKKNRVEINVKPEEVDKFDKSLYEIDFVPAHKKFVRSIGYFVGFESISNSSDRYLLLDEGSGSILRYRLVGRAETRMAEFPETLFGVEETFSQKSSARSILKILDLGLNDGNMNKIIKSFKVGDVVVVFPRTTDGVLDKDNNGEVVCEFVIMRRAFGYYELKFEMLFN